jgi:hypothetical protein
MGFDSEREPAITQWFAAVPDFTTLHTPKQVRGSRVDYSGFQVSQAGIPAIRLVLG